MPGLTLRAVNGALGRMFERWAADRIPDLTGRTFVVTGTYHHRPGLNRHSPAGLNRHSPAGQRGHSSSVSATSPGSGRHRGPPARPGRPQIRTALRRRPPPPAPRRPDQQRRRDGRAAHAHRRRPRTEVRQRQSRQSALTTPLLAQPADRDAWPLLFAAAGPAAEAGMRYGPNGPGEQRGHPVPVRLSAAATGQTNARPGGPGLGLAGPRVAPPASGRVPVRSGRDVGQVAQDF